MVSALAAAALLSASFFIPFLLLLGSLPAYLRFLTRRGRVWDDVHKRPMVKVPAPAGPILFLAALAGELAVALISESLIPVAIIMGAGVAFAIGLVDDL